MGTNHNRQDESLDKALAALRDAAPPEGMEARVLARLAQQPVIPSAWARLAQSAWLRGALTGALVATAACALAFFIVRPQHHVQTQSHDIAKGAPVRSAGVAPVVLSASAPCGGRVPRLGAAGVGNIATNDRVPHPGFAWVGGATAIARSPRLIPASFAPSRPAPPVPLTAQERALVQLVRSASPAELAALNPAAEEKSDAQREADFQKFFAPSPELVAAKKAQDEALGITTPAAPEPTQIHN